MPPRYIETRWHSWLEAVLYFTKPENRVAVKKAMRDIMENDPNNEHAINVLALLIDKDVEEGAKFIKSNYTQFGKLILSLEKKSMTLKYAVQKIEEINYECNNDLQIPDSFKDRFDELFNKNAGFQAISKLSKGEIVSNFVNMTTEERDLILNGPASSSEAERSFSTVNCVLRPNRNRFKVGSFCMQIIINKYINSLVNVSINKIKSRKNLKNKKKV